MSESIFKIFAALYTTFGLQIDDMIIIFLLCFRKVVLKNAVSERWYRDSRLSSVISSSSSLSNCKVSITNKCCYIKNIIKFYLLFFSETLLKNKHEYTYRYTITTSSSVTGASKSASGSKIACTVTVSVPRKCELMFQVSLPQNMS